MPGKPIRFVVNCHQHFDHAGGLRAAVAEGATIVTQAANVPYFERAFAQPNRIAPDAHGASRASARSFLRGRRASSTSATARAPVEIHRIADSPHSDSFLMVYLPKEKLLIEADAFTPAPPNTPPPAAPNANNVNLIDNIERLKLGGRAHPAAARPRRAAGRALHRHAAADAALRL